MGNAIDNEKYNYAEITEASVWSRPMNVKALEKIGHWGVVVRVKGGHGSFLIHNVPDKGVVVTSTKNMGPKWTKKKDIPINRKANIRQCLQVTSGASTNYISNGTVRYIVGLTCLGSTAAIADFLENVLRL